MQGALSESLYSINVKKEVFGFSVPWEVETFDNDFRVAETRGGFFELSFYSFINITGPDSTDFLHRMTSSNVRDMTLEKLTHSSLLTHKGKVISLGYLEKMENGYQFIVGQAQGKKALEHLTKFHFSENLEIKDLSAEFTLFGLWNLSPKFYEMWNLDPTIQPFHKESRIWQSQTLQLWRDDTQEPLLWLKLKRKESPYILKLLKKEGFQLLGHRLFDYFRMKYKVPIVGIEITDDSLILETGFDRAVSRNKGCYPGQEVVERIFTYGGVNKKLFQVEFSTSDPVAIPCPLFSGNEPAGELLSFSPVPTKKGDYLGLASVHKKFWDVKKSFNNGSKKLEFRIRC